MSKDMGYSGNRGDSIEVPSDPVDVLITQMRTELFDLVTQHREIVQRIRSLRKVMHGLQEISAPPLWARQASRAGREKVLIPSSDRRNIGPPASRLCGSTNANIRLQRACRIALMEAEGAASLDEICARIRRRGSFYFATEKCRTADLLQTLEAMARHGDIRQLQRGSLQGWQLMARVNEV